MNFHGEHHKSNVFIVLPISGNMSFASNISTFGEKKLVNGIINKIRFEWFGTNVKASVIASDILLDSIEMPEIIRTTEQKIDYTMEFIDVYPELSSITNIPRTYTVIAKDDNQDIVAEACGNYWISEYSYNSSTAYTNGTYSIVNIPGEDYPYGYSIVKGYLTDDDTGVDITDCLDTTGSRTSPTSNAFSNYSTITSY